MRGVPLLIKKFIFAMVKCGELPCTISNIATNLHKPVKSISPTRAQLINKGLVYSARYGELDFTVPEFTGFIQRQEDYNKWCSTEAVNFLQRSFIYEIFREIWKNGIQYSFGFR